MASKIFIKGMEVAGPGALQSIHDEIDVVAADLSSYKEEVNTALDNITEEVKDIIAESGEAEPIVISSTGITISVANNHAALLNALNTLLQKEEYRNDWLATDDKQTTLELHLGSTFIDFKLGEQYYQVNRIVLRDPGVESKAIGVSFFLDGSWAADGQTSTDPFMEYYYEHIENISYTDFYFSKEDYNLKLINNIYSDLDMTVKDYVSMVGLRYFNPVDYYQTLTVDNEVEYEPENPYNPATKKYVDDKALISAFTYFMVSHIDFGGVDVINNPSQEIIFEEEEKNQLTEFINRYRQQKSFLHVTLEDGTEFLCDSLDNINLNETTNVFALSLEGKDDERIGTVYMEGTKNDDTGHYTVNIAKITIVRNPKAAEYANLQTYVENTIGNLEDLDTTDKSNVVAAVNETLGTFTADYYTKDEVRPAPYVVSTGVAFNASSETISISDLTQFSTAITDAYQKGLSNIDFYLKYNAQNATQSIFACSMVGNIQLKQTYYEGYYYHNNLHCLRRLYVSGSWKDTTFTATSAQVTLAFDMWHFVSTKANGFVSSYTIPTQTNFDKAPKLTNHSTITDNNHLVDKQYVTEAINSIPGVDLSGYYTSTQVDSKISKLDEEKQDTLIAGDNITITNNIISASGGGSGSGVSSDATITVLDFSDGYTTINDNGIRTINSTGLSKLSELFTSHYQKKGEFNSLVFAIKAEGVFELFYTAGTVNTTTNIYFTRRGFKSTSSNGAHGATLFNEYLTQEFFNISINDATVTCSGVNGGTNFSAFTSATFGNNVLTKTNTTAYTPTAEYHPTTKKYVDTAVSNMGAKKQDTLVAGTNITIENNIISAINAGGSGSVGDSNLQVTAMPEATPENEGAVVEYIGNDNDLYKRGYFYRSSATNVFGMDKLTLTGGQATTRLRLKSNYKIEMKVQLTTYTSGAMFFGSNHDASYYALRVYNGYYAYGLNGASTTSSIAYSTGNDLVLVYNDDEGNITVNNAIIQTGIATPNATNNYLGLFNTSFKGIFYYCKVWDKATGNLVAEFIPVSYNNTTAIYDKVNHNFAAWYSSSSVTAGTTETALTQYRHWMPLYVQTMRPDYTWSTALEHMKFYEDLQTIMDLYSTGVYANYSLGGYHLSHIAQTNSSSNNNYRLYTLYFSRMYNNISYTRTITLYTLYSGYTIYGPESRYIPTLNASDVSNNFITAHQSLANYLAKNNTEVYAPTGNYNPATKKYVDDLIASKDLTQYLAKTNRIEYVPTAPYNPATKQYVDSLVTAALADNTGLRFKQVETLPTEDISTNTIYLTGSSNPYNMYIYVEDAWLSLGTSEIDLDPTEETFEGTSNVVTNNYVLENLNPSSKYIFQLNSQGFFESTNKADNSYSLCKITFNNSTQIELPITYISSGESGYDYGIFSKLDTTLALSNADDGATGVGNVFKNCKGEASLEPKTITYTVPAGEHFIYIKYRKDGSQAQGNDSLQFQFPDEFIEGAAYTIDILKPNYVYKLNTLGFLVINEAPIFNRETVLYMRSEVNGIYVTLPSTWTHLGDKPVFTTQGDGKATGYLEGSKNYIASFMNGVVIWKAYDIEMTAVEDDSKGA